MERLNGCQELGHYSAMCSRSDASGSGVMQGDIPMPLSGMPCFPFYRPRESRGYNGREEGKGKRNKAPGGVPSSSSCGSTDPIDRGGSDVAPGFYWPLQHTCGRRAQFLSCIPFEQMEWSKGPLTEAM